MSDFAPVSFEFNLEESGWANLVVALADDAIRIERIGYLTDALDDLLIAGLHLSFGWGEEVVTFDQEGQETEVRFEGEWVERPRPIGPDGIYADLRLRISVIELGDRKKTLKSGLCRDFDQASKALLDMGDKVLAEYGVERYDELWTSSGFPNRALEALRAALSVELCLGYRDRY